MEGPVNSEAMTLDMWGVGFPAYTCFVFFVHFQYISSMRDWNKVNCFFVALIIFFFFGTIAVAQRIPRASWTFYAHMLEILSTPMYYLVIPPALFIMVLPFMLEKLYHRYIKHPVLYKH